MKKIGEMLDADVFVDAGAQWLHGKQNELYEVAERNDLLRNELSEEGLGEYLRDDGCKVDDFLVKKVDFLVGQILEEAETYAQTDHGYVPASIGDFLRQQFDMKVSTNFKSDEREIAKQLLDWHIRFQVIDNSCLSIADVSAKLWGTYSFNGESCQAHINTRYGFQAIVDNLVEDIGTQNIIFDKPVAEIRWKDFNSRIIVKCADGTVYTCQHLIVTFSLGVLKASLAKLFQPALPKPYNRSIRNIGFGTIDKIFLQFENAWWEKAEGFQLIWRDEHKDDSHWTRFMTGFDVVTPGPPNTLLGWVGGYGALEMEKLSDEQIISDCIFILEKFTKKTVPQPIRFFCSHWNSNPFIRGAYSYTSVNCDDEPHFQKTVTEPIICSAEHSSQQSTHSAMKTSATLSFAGEAFHDKYFSTVHGAYLSGIEQAKRLLYNHTLSS